MLTRSLLTATTLTLCLAGLTACQSTETGIKHRAEARQRLDLFNAQIAYDQAEQAFEVGRFDRALRQIESAISLYPEMAEYHLLQGRIFLETHRLEEALRSFQTTLEHDQASHIAHYYAGIVYQRWSDDEQALSEYQAAAEIDPSDVSYLLASAESLVALGELDEARELIQSRLDYFEHNAAMHHLLGQIALMQNDYQSAVESYNEARVLNPDDDSILEELARAQYHAGHYQPCYESVLELQRLSEEPRRDLKIMEARCLALLGRSMDARNVYSSLSREDPNDVSVWVELGTLAWELEDFHRVAQCSAQLLTLAPERYEGWMLRGINERHLGNVDNALVQFREATSRASDSPLPHVLLGLTLEQSGQGEPALAAYRDALTIDPDCRQADLLYQRLSSGSQVTSVPGMH